MRILLFIIVLGGVFYSCDHVKNPYPPEVNLELDTTLYPGLWSDYENNEWPTFSQNTNTNRNVLIEDFTGHKCVFCPAAADLAHVGRRELAAEVRADLGGEAGVGVAASAGHRRRQRDP